MTGFASLLLFVFYMSLAELCYGWNFRVLLGGACARAYLEGSN